MRYWFYRRFGLDKNDCARYISTVGLRDTPLGKSCAAVHSIECDEKSKYRSIDGTCNNIENPSWGSAMTAYTRVLFSQYFDGKCHASDCVALPSFSSLLLSDLSTALARDKTSLSSLDSSRLELHPDGTSLY